jgi:adenylate cyclase
MDAPPTIDPITAHSDCDVVHWLTNDTRDERFMTIFSLSCVSGSSERGFLSSGRRFMS